MRKASKQNADAFEVAVEGSFHSSRRILEGLVATPPQRMRARFEELKRLRVKGSEAR
jgi:hypothetical protein